MSDQAPFADLENEKFYSVKQVAALFPGRSQRWVIDRVKAGDFGSVIQDSGQWLVPLSGIRSYLQARLIKPGELTAGQNIVNLRRGRSHS